MGLYTLHALTLQCPWYVQEEQKGSLGMSICQSNHSTSLLSSHLRHIGRTTEAG